MKKQTVQRLATASLLSALLTLPAQATDTDPTTVSADSQNSGVLWMSEFVSRAQLTSGVDSREPVDQLSGALAVQSGETHRIYFFTEISQMSGKQVRHQWLHQERVVADMTFNIGSDRWRTWSSKQVPADWTGDWRVRVLAMDGEILADQAFSYY